MDRRIRAAAALSAVFAQEGAPTLVSLRAIPFVAGCVQASLPPRCQVGAWAVLRNFGQLYATYERQMAGIGRACPRPGVDRVQAVMQASPARAEPRYVALRSKTPRVR